MLLKLFFFFFLNSLICQIKPYAEKTQKTGTGTTVPVETRVRSTAEPPRSTPNKLQEAQFTIWEKNLKNSGYMYMYN